jgi:hypothetical protein
MKNDQGTTPTDATRVPYPAWKIVLTVVVVIAVIIGSLNYFQMTLFVLFIAIAVNGIVAVCRRRMNSYTRVAGYRTLTGGEAVRYGLVLAVLGLYGVVRIYPQLHLHLYH